MLKVVFRADLSDMNAMRKYTKTEQRIIRALYRLQSKGSLEAGTLGTYERLLLDTLGSRSALLGACQRLVKEGILIRHKVNAGDRKRWGKRWPTGYARRQAHFSLSPAMMAATEALDYDHGLLDEGRTM